MTDPKTNPAQWAREQANKLAAEEDERLSKIEQRATAAHEKNQEDNRREEERRNPKISIEEVQARRGREELEQFRQAQHRLWTANGGTSEEFEAAWPEIKRRHLEEQSARAYNSSTSAY